MCRQVWVEDGNCAQQLHRLFGHYRRELLHTGLSNRNGEILVVKKLRGTLTRIGCHNFSQVLSPLTS